MSSKQKHEQTVPVNYDFKGAHLSISCSDLKHRLIPACRCALECKWLLHLLQNWSTERGGLQVCHDRLLQPGLRKSCWCHCGLCLIHLICGLLWLLDSQEQLGCQLGWIWLHQTVHPYIGQHGHLQRRVLDQLSWYGLGQDKKLYACKRFKREHMNRRMCKNLSEEIKVLKLLSGQINSNTHSPYIEYKDTFKTKRHFYLMVEYCNGGDLEQLLNAGLILKEKHVSFIYR